MNRLNRLNRLNRRQTIGAGLAFAACALPPLSAIRAQTSESATPAPPPRTFYVDHERGANDAAGTQSDPFATIKQAVAVVSAGDRVEIAAGQYEDAVTIDRGGSQNAPVVFAAAAGADVRITGEVVTLATDYVILEGLRIEGANDDESGAIFITKGTGIELRNLTVRENDGAGVRAKPIDGPIVGLRIVGGMFSENGGAGIALTGEEDALVTLTIDGVTVENNAGDGIQIERASQVALSNLTTAHNGADDERNGVFLKNVKGATVTGIRTQGNGHDGIALRQSESITISRSISTENEHHGFDSIEDCKNISFINNVSYRNGDAEEDKGLYVTATAGITILNNIFAYNFGDQLAFSNEGGPVDDVRSDNNLFWREGGERLLRWFSDYFADLPSFQAASGLDASSRVAEPAFADPANGDFSLLPPSPAIDAGTVVPPITDGYSGTAPDIGVVELSAAS